MESQRNMNCNLSNFSISTAPADSLAQLGDRPSAGEVMTKFTSHVYMGPAPQGFNSWGAMEYWVTVY